MPNSSDEKPLTFSQLVQFYREVIKPEIKQEGFSQLVTFYREVMKPELEEMVETKIEEKITPLRMTMMDGFDDLYKKYECIQQELVITNHHIRRLDEAVFGKKGPRVH